MSNMSLSNKTYDELASALKDNVIEFIHSDERYVNFMLEIIPDAIKNSLGEVDDQVLNTLSFCIMDKILLH